MHYDRISGPSAKAYRLLEKIAALDQMLRIAADAVAAEERQEEAVAPPDPFRCPPGPYERASLIAYYFKQYKLRAKILILDAKDSFFLQDVFEDGWNRHYPGMIEWLPAQFTGGIKAVDVKDRLIKTGGDSFKADVARPFCT
jgi:hypothetical protein